VDTKTILRSLIDFGDVEQEELVLNMRKVQNTTFQWDRKDDQRLYQFCVTFFQSHLELPSERTVRDFFRKHDNIEALERLQDVKADSAYTRSNFTFHLQSLLNEQHQSRAVAYLQEAREIILKGAKVEGEMRRGVRDGILHFVQHTNGLIVPEGNAKTRGDIRQDGQKAWDDYQAAKRDKSKAWGRFTGLNHIDRVCHGIKKGDLWVHAGFAGELKTTFAINWAYNLVTRYRTNVFYVSLEMKYEHLMRLIYVLHSAHARFRLEGYQPLDYRKVRDGELTEEEEKFYELVIKDFSTNPEYCRFEVWAPDRDVTIPDIRMEAELMHREMEIGLVVLDHGGLIEIEKTKRSSDYTIALNSVLRGAKKFALHFNHGEGIPILLLFQINRDGKDYADKNEGLYRMRALSYANEAERSADVITTTYLNEDHRGDGTTKFCNLKNRDNPLFEPFLASVNFICRRMQNENPYGGQTGNGMEVSDHREVLMDVI